jgi:hypothetical protein
VHQRDYEGKDKEVAGEKDHMVQDEVEVGIRGGLERGVEGVALSQ